MLGALSHLQCTDTRGKHFATLNIVSSGIRGIQADHTITRHTLANPGPA
jgi:hypothetical protein